VKSDLLGIHLERARRWRGLACRSILVTIAVLGGMATARAQELAIDPSFDAAGLFHEGLAPVKVDGSWGLIDRNGRMVVKPQYDGVLGGSDGRFAVLKDGLWGYVTSGGALTIEPRFEAVRPFKDGVAAVKAGGLWGYITPSGQFLEPPKFEQVSDFDSGFALVIATGECRIYHRSGETPVEGSDGDFPLWLPGARDGPRDLVLQEISEGRGILRVDDKRYYVAKERGAYGGYEIARPYNEGLAAVRVAPDRWTYVDLEGKVAMDASFEGAREFGNGVAPAARDGRWGYIDRRGRFVVRPQFDQAYSFAEGYAVVRNGDARGFLQMDERGRIGVFVAPRFEDVFRFSEGLAPVKIGGKWGYLAARRQPQVQSVRGVADLKP
jgi:hypothetical protein